MNLKNAAILCFFCFVGILNGCGYSENIQDSQTVDANAVYPAHLDNAANTNSEHQTNATSEQQTPPANTPIGQMPNPTDTAGTNMETIIQEEAAMEKNINEYRAQKGLSLYIFDERVRAVARKHSENMATGITPFGHTGFSERVAQVNTMIPNAGGAENVGMCSYYDPVSTIFTGWQQSPGHNANMLRAFTNARAGIGYILNANQESYFTLLVVDAIK